MVEKTIKVKGRLISLERPLVMGIINATPDSFYESSRCADSESVERRARVMVSEGADMLDIGAYSTRPGASDISVAEEKERLDYALEAIRRTMPDVILSIDTFRAEVAAHCVERWGADIINDISGGDLDTEMFDTIASLRVPYILMHTRGTPANMQQHTDYEDLCAEVLTDLAFKLDRLRQKGVTDVIIDPGFGFAKTVDQNYELLGGLHYFESLNAPILAGMSRKSMIWKLLDSTPEEAVNGTTALNMAALLAGADILRVHDVRPAVETVRIYEALKRNTRKVNSITNFNYRKP